MNINTIAEFLNSKHLKYSYKKRIINLLGLFLGRKKRKELRNMLVDNYDEITFKQADVCFYNKDLNNKIIKLENHIPHDVSLAYFVESNLKKIKPRKKWIYMDAGCGTGYTLWKASSSFSKVIGVEYMSELAHIAQDNLKKLKVSNATVINDDICNISPEILKNVNVFYM